MSAEDEPPLNKWYRLSRTFRRAFSLSFYALLAVLLFFMLFAVPAFQYVPPIEGPRLPQEASAATWTSLELAIAAFWVSVASLVVSAIGVVSTFILGWRADRRQAVEAALKLQQHQIELAAAEAAAKRRKRARNSN